MASNFSWVCVGVMGALCIASPVGADELARDQAAFQSTAAIGARSSGSPVGPPAKVTLCHNGKTITVSEPAVAAHLAKGDTLGPCPGDSPKGNNGLGNGVDPQPPGNPPVNDDPGTGPGNPGKAK